MSQKDLYQAKSAVILMFRGILACQLPIGILGGLKLQGYEASFRSLSVGTGLRCSLISSDLAGATFISNNT